jgi:hypothetical protein
VRSKKVLPWVEMRCLSSNHGNRFTHSTCGGEKANSKKGKGRKAKHKKSQKRYISYSHSDGHRDGSNDAISMKFKQHVDMVNVINTEKFDDCTSNCLDRAHATGLALTHCHKQVNWHSLKQFKPHSFPRPFNFRILQSRLVNAKLEPFLFTYYLRAMYFFGLSETTNNFA